MSIDTYGAEIMGMTAQLDEVDWQLLDELQHDARHGFRELGRRVSLSAPAVAARIRRLERLGVITGYHAHVDPERAGYAAQAFVVVTTPGRRASVTVAGLAADNPRILEDHRITGTDDHLLRVVSPTLSDLEPVIDTLNEHGKPATSVVLSTPKPWAPLPPP